MTSQVKKVLHINLSKEDYEVKSYQDLRKYLGGLGLGLSILQVRREKDPVVFSIGPLNGFFPFASKTSIVEIYGKEIEKLYLGGALSARIKFCGFDAICFEGTARKSVILNIVNDRVEFFESVDLGDLGLPGKRSVAEVTPAGIFLDGHFEPSQGGLFQKLVKKNVKAFVVTGTHVTEVADVKRYSEIYTGILKRYKELNAKKSNNPSCFGCPLGCNKAYVGEKEGNVLVHCLAACAFSEPIYSNVNTVFSCLNVLGYDYTHEDIENVPHLVYDLISGS